MPPDSSRPDYSQDPHRIDKQMLRRAFERAADSYDEAALLQREVGARMLDRLDLIKLAPKLILDIGAGTGVCSAALAQRYKDSAVLALDIAMNMLRQARSRTPRLSQWLGRRRHFVCGDAESLPLANHCADMIFSNLTLQWCDDLDHTFAEFRRVLKPGGLLLFSTFGPDTLKELRRSWSQVDGYTHTNAFIDMHDIGDALLRTRFGDPVMDVENFTLTYADMLALMRDLKTIGAHNVTAGRATGLTGKNQLRQVGEVYESYRKNGVLPATYEVVYGHAWLPDAANSPPPEPGVTRIPLAQIKVKSSSLARE